MKNQPKSYQRKEAIIDIALTAPIGKKTMEVYTGLRMGWEVGRYILINCSSFIKTSLKSKVTGVIHLGKYPIRMQY